MKTVLLVLLLNVVTAWCGVLSWQATSGSWAAIWGLGLALGLFADWVWLLTPPRANSTSDYSRDELTAIATGQFPLLVLNDAIVTCNHCGTTLGRDAVGRVKPCTCEPYCPPALHTEVPRPALVRGFRHAKGRQ